MPMNKFSTLSYLISSYRAGKRKLKSFQTPKSDFGDCALDINQIGFEPSQSSIDAILSFASQCEVLHSKKTGTIELNLN
jgi:hypothetical protein